MSDRDWFFFSAVGLALIAGLVFAGSINHERQRTGHYESAKEQYDSAHERVAASAPVTQSLIADVEAYRQEWREEQDLFAQRDMAKWAWLMMLASFAGVSITAVGVVFVAQTLIATREAVAAANRTADEAKRIGEAQTRGYLSCERGKLYIHEKTIWFELSLMNRGQSPLIADTVTASFFLIHDFTQLGTWSPTGRYSSISAGETSFCRLHIMKANVGEENTTLMESDAARVALHVNFTWRDVFGTEMWASYALLQKAPPALETVDEVTVWGAELEATCIAAYWGEKKDT